MNDLPENAKRMIEEYICPGCVNGPLDSGCYKALDGGNAYGYGCSAHVIGTFGLSFGHFVIGLPKGFNRPGPNDRRDKTRNNMLIRTWPQGTSPDWDNLNVPVWAMVHKGTLFVRTYMPRINDAAIDVVEGGTLELVPNAIDVGKFLEEID